MTLNLPNVPIVGDTSKVLQTISTSGIQEKLQDTFMPLTMLEFFQRGFNVPAKDNRFDQFQLQFSPWVSCLCSWFDDPTIDWVYLIQGSQTCKTTFLEGALLYVSKYISGACPAFWAMSTEDEAKHFIDARLKPFLDDAAKESISKWKERAFRLNNSLVKIGYAGNKTSLKSHPARFIFGDECAGWRVPPRYLRKRTRTFSNSRKGFFATTPPDAVEHASWGEATAGDFYQWWVKCPACNRLQPLLFKNLRFSGAKIAGNWDFERLRDVTFYQCQYCSARWKEDQKLAIINSGEPICVDCSTYEPKQDSGCATKTLQVNALYSVFCRWADIASDFIDAKQAGQESFRIFVTDELAEVMSHMGEEIHVSKVRRLCDATRVKGDLGNYDLYTAGVDLQETGALYCSIVGWKAGASPTAHVITYFCVSWKTGSVTPNWDLFLEELAPYQHKIVGCALDASNGKDYQSICDFVNFTGAPFIALKEVPKQATKTRWVTLEVDPITRQRCTTGQKLLEVNSHLIKNDIASAFDRGNGTVSSWSLPGDTEDTYLLHLTNEVPTDEIRRGVKTLVWKPKYKHAPQHYFSSLVYAVAVAEDYRLDLQRATKRSKNTVKSKPQTTSPFGDINKFDFRDFVI